MIFRRAFVYALAVSHVLSGCQTTGSGEGFSVGPQLSSFFEKKDITETLSNLPKLDVIIPVFDPGIPEDVSTQEEKGIWPELRRAEANRFAVKLKHELEKTGAFGAVRVAPDRTATGDIYVVGTIKESDGEDVEFKLEVFDISGDRWLSKTFDHEVEEAFHKNYRNKGTDPYDPAFKEAAEYIVEELADQEAAYLTRLQKLTEVRFGANLSEEAFSEHLKLDDGDVILASMPADDDPMLERARAIRVRDQLFLDRLQTGYHTFSTKMEESYFLWQEQSLIEVKAKREAELEAAGEAILGVALIGLAILGAAYSARSNDYGSADAAAIGAIGAGVAGGMLLSESFKTSEEAKVHRDALNELGQSIDMELAPQVIAFEDKTMELTGDAKEQFAQWRNFLKEIYAMEKTPDIQL